MEALKVFRYAEIKLNVRIFDGFSKQNTAHETISSSDGNMQTIECVYVFFDSLSRKIDLFVENIFYFRLWEVI